MFWEEKGIYPPGLSMVNHIAYHTLWPLRAGIFYCVQLNFAQCGRLNSLLLTNRIMHSYTCRDFIVDKVYSSLTLIFGIDNMPCFSHWDIVRCDISRCLKCTCVVGLASLHSSGCPTWRTCPFCLDSEIGHAEQICTSAWSHGADLEHEAQLFSWTLPRLDKL